MYQLAEKKQETDFFKQVIDKTLFVNNEINRALKSIKAINNRTHMLSITAKIEANRTGDAGRNFLVVSNSIDELCTKTDSVLDKMKNETIQEIKTISKIIENKSISIQGNRLANLALTNIRIVDRNLFERTADIRWLATDNVLITSLIINKKDAYQNSHERLNHILNSYSVYNDLILCDANGICKSTGAEKFGFFGQDFSDSLWFKNALATENGTFYGFQSVTQSSINDDDFIIIYSCKIHEDGDPKNKVIGVLGAVFKWKKFAQRIIYETGLSDDEKSNTRVLLCNDSGKILADSDEKILESINFNGQQELFKKKKDFTITTLNNQKKLICHASSTGFEGYTSQNWHSLIIRDIDTDNYDKELSSDESLDSVLGFISNISEKTQKTIDEINKINDDTQVLSINAAIESARIGDSGLSFAVITEFMSDLSRTTAEITTNMAQNIREKITDLNSFISLNSKQIQGKRLANLSFTNIDLIDRTLYERTADVCWWATERSIIESLIQKTGASRDYLSNRLETLLRYYTVYEDLIVCDLDGNVIANGNRLLKLRNTNIKNSSWFQNALNLRNNNYGFEVLREGREFTKILFFSNVYEDYSVSKTPVGILGTVFKWREFINHVFYETPLQEDELDSTSLFILDTNGNKLAERNKLKNDVTYNDLSKLIGKIKNFETTKLFDSEVTLGYASSSGYENFFTGWNSIIIQSQKSCILNQNS